LDGKAVGTRKRIIKKDRLEIEITLVDSHIVLDKNKLNEQAKKYADFL
jgi:phage-related protein